MDVNELNSKLQNALEADFLTYEQVKKITGCGIYIIYKDDKVLYVGKTDRDGRVRLRELVSDYRSHTLNRKLLRVLLSEFLNTSFPPLTKTTKHQLIAGGIISEENFINLQRQINAMIKTEFRFKFWPIESESILRLEHFAIAILNPEMND